MQIKINRESPLQPKIADLIEKSNDYMASLYPATSNHLVDLNSLTGSHVDFLVVRVNGEIQGCCALVEAGDGTGEIKRMYVDESARGLGLGKKLLEEIFSRGRLRGLSHIRLETGISQPEAIGLYRKAGFEEILAFPPYHPDALSMFMEKPLI
jgi:putative acetyltransferase